jgi:hypothetical protein
MLPVSIRISDDYYTVTTDFERTETEGIQDSYGFVLAELQRLKVTYGIKHEAIKEAVQSEKSLYDVVIAEGDRHLNGSDAYITHCVLFEGKSKPLILEDGTVDFKNLLQVSAVKAGDVLAIKTPVKPGIDGLTVTGKAIKHRPGKDAVWKYGENVLVSEDGNTLSAQDHGIAKLINGRITVSQIIEVDEVGPKTGNIYFGGDVHVKESVLVGYTVHCDGDLTIDGVIEGCIIKTKGNLTVSKGILGSGTSDIVVGGNLIAKFIENATVYVKGEIETGEIINSRVLCDSKIVVKGKKGLIIGGEITSKYMIEANHIGSRLGVLTTINLGVDASIIEELKSLKVLVQDLKILETRLKMRIPVLKSNVLMQPEVGVHEDILKQYEDSLLGTQIDLEEKEQRLEQLMGALKNASQGKLKSNGVFPDTMVRIGTSKYFIDRVLDACIISKADDDQIVAISIEKTQK